MKTRIHVNQHVIKSNHRNHTCDPVLTIKTYKSNTPQLWRTGLDRD